MRQPWTDPAAQRKQPAMWHCLNSVVVFDIFVGLVFGFELGWYVVWMDDVDSSEGVWGGREAQLQLLALIPLR